MEVALCRGNTFKSSKDGGKTLVSLALSGLFLGEAKKGLRPPRLDYATFFQCATAMVLPTVQ